jgi:hypothetical protein
MQEEISPPMNFFNLWTSRRRTASRWTRAAKRRHLDIALVQKAR